MTNTPCSLTVWFYLQHSLNQKQSKQGLQGGTGHELGNASWPGNRSFSRAVLNTFCLLPLWIQEVKCLSARCPLPTPASGQEGLCGRRGHPRTDLCLLCIHGGHWSWGTVTATPSSSPKQHSLASHITQCPAGVVPKACLPESRCSSGSARVPQGRLYNLACRKFKPKAISFRVMEYKQWQSKIWHLLTQGNALYKHVFGVFWFLSQPNTLESVHTLHNDTSNIFLLLHTGDVLCIAFNSSFSLHVQIACARWGWSLDSILAAPDEMCLESKVKVVYEPQIFTPGLLHCQPCPSTALQPGWKRSSALCVPWKASSL